MEFVCHPDMTDNEIKIQTAIWELVTTEVDYIHALKTVTDVSFIYAVYSFIWLFALFIRAHSACTTEL